MPPSCSLRYGAPSIGCCPLGIYGVQGRGFSTKGKAAGHFWRNNQRKIAVFEIETTG